MVVRTRGRNLFFSTDVDAVIEDSDIIFISVNTPTKTQGIGAGRAANIKNCELAARNIAKANIYPPPYTGPSLLPACLNVTVFFCVFRL